MTHTYHINFTLDGEPHQEPFQAPNAGEAFAKCLKEHPSAILIHGCRFGKIPAGPASEHVELNYDPPPVQRPLSREPKPVKISKKPSSDEMVFPFLETCCKKR